MQVDVRDIPLSTFRETAVGLSRTDQESFWTGLAFGAVAGIVASDMACPSPFGVADIAVYLRYRASATSSLADAVRHYLQERGCTRQRLQDPGQPPQHEQGRKADIRRRPGRRTRSSRP